MKSSDRKGGDESCKPQTQMPKSARTKGGTSALGEVAVSLDTGRSAAHSKQGGGRARAKVHEAIAAAANLNSQDNGTAGMESKNTVFGLGGDGSGTGGKKMATTTNTKRIGSKGPKNEGSANSQAQNSNYTPSDDYESSKVVTKNSGGGSIQRNDLGEDERAMVADLDRFDANDENDALDDSF